MLSVSVLILGYRVYTRECSNVSLTSPAMAPTLARGNVDDVGCKAGDLSCDVGGVYISIDQFSYFPCMSISLLFVYSSRNNSSTAQLRAKNVAKKSEQVEQAVKESEHEAARKRERDEAAEETNAVNIPKGANVDGNKS